jgi:Ca-activated chloride channel homolog
MSAEHTPRVEADAEAREAALTAYALDDLDGLDRDGVEQRLCDPREIEARRQVAETRVLASALRQAHTVQHAADAPARLPDLRRAVLVAASRSQPRPQTTTTWILKCVVPLASLAAALAVAVTATLWRQDAFHVAAARRSEVRPESAAIPQAIATGEKRTLGRSMPAAKADAFRETAGPIAGPPPARDRMPMLRDSDAEPLPGNRGLDLADELIRRMPAAGEDARRLAEHREAYARVAESRMASPREQPLSTFSIDVDTASYANVRRFLASGWRPPRDAVRIEELVNYFRYDYPQPQGDVPFSVTVDAAECPWRPGHRLVRIGLQGRDIDRGARPAGNLVFLVDVSGSMQAANKLALVKQALAMLVEQLTESDRVSIVTYAGNTGLALPPTTGDQKQAILAAIDRLTPGGSTHGSAGITLAYEQAREHFIEGGSNRVILATDGDLNVGVTSTTALVDLIKEQARAAVFLTVLGFGEGNLQDDKLEALADNGNGIYAYIDGVREARKVLVEQLTGSTVTIAKDVKIQVEFNPAQVASYRLLGYENRALAARDFKDDAKDAGEIGAGHSVTALYEVVLVGGESTSGGGAELLKYQREPAPPAPAAVDPQASRELLTVKLRWKRPDGDTSTLLEVPLADRGGAFATAPADLRFAAAVAAFGMILRESPERGDATLPLVARIAGAALGRDESGYRAEFLDLVRRAEGPGVAR